MSMPVGNEAVLHRVSFSEAKPGVYWHVLESAEFLRLSHGLILAFVSADPVLGNPIRLA
jgi:hypothetical protein